MNAMSHGVVNASLGEALALAQWAAAAQSVSAPVQMQVAQALAAEFGLAPLLAPLVGVALPPP
ncbi:MAG: hypothetical protein ACRCYV_04240 [Aeromonas sp.]